jgi:hypothetical protein
MIVWAGNGVIGVGGHSLEEIHRTILLLIYAMHVILP